MMQPLGNIDTSHLPTGENGLRVNKDNEKADRVREERDRFARARVRSQMDKLPRRTRRR